MLRTRGLKNVSKLKTHIVFCWGVNTESDRVDLGISSINTVSFSLGGIMDEMLSLYVDLSSSKGWGRQEVHNTHHAHHHPNSQMLKFKCLVTTSPVCSSLLISFMILLWQVRIALRCYSCRIKSLLIAEKLICFFFFCAQTHSIEIFFINALFSWKIKFDLK